MDVPLHRAAGERVQRPGYVVWVSQFYTLLLKNMAILRHRWVGEGERLTGRVAWSCHTLGCDAEPACAPPRSFVPLFCVS